MDEEGAGLLYIYVSDRGEGTRQQQQQLGTTDSEIKLVELLKSTSSDDYWQLAVPVSVTPAAARSNLSRYNIHTYPQRGRHL